MKIQPVRSEAEHDAALARITQLMGARAGTEASDELEILVTLVDAYETKHFPMDTPDPATIIKFKMEQQGLTRKDLEPMIGSRARVSEVLTGKRTLTLPMIRRLHSLLGIPVDLLVGIYPAPSRSSERSRRKPTVAVPRPDRRIASQASGR
jgi:HTH-type transcriptional regulator/antitoxin HigA